MNAIPYWVTQLIVFKRIRAWLHRRNVHAFCRKRRYLDLEKEFIRTHGGETLDITNFAGTHRTVHF